jgi:hypothetical protein
MEAGWRRNYLRYKSFFLNMLTQYRERSDWKAYLEILLSLLTISIFAIFALRPTVLTIAELIGQIEEKKETVEKMDSKIQNLGKAQSLYDREAQNILLLTQSVIAKTPNSDIFARQIEGLSVKHQITVASVSLGEAVLFSVGNPTTQEPNPETQTEVHETMDFSVSLNLATEQYENALAFIKDFQNLRSPAKVSDMKISVEENDEDQNSSTQNDTTKKLTLVLEGKVTYIR